MQIREINEIYHHQEELSHLFQEVVASGASMNYFHPMHHETAMRYWAGVLSDHHRLFVAILDGKIAGTVQLHLSDKENGQHRAEVAKLMTHPDFQRKGVGKALLQHAEKMATEENRWLLMLDTEKGSAANALYLSEGYQLIGEVPAYSQDPFGKYKDGNVYYKLLK
ncbi:GNAT family N-acetyltransferase [Salinicoccus cyprini]|uniref:GNAT family N-acetyltransferase n=1 Tax=Salinicoccus cyprini TaxID=2493691 RepID=A0A558AYF2_9STAP|nr:GNAT family N-acetyltransferase [Salinicoccus cyprini]TVT29289.1 GNAT family N-acetyltransferase [Salinicoccus cyprini]